MLVFRFVTSSQGTFSGFREDLEDAIKSGSLRTCSFSTFGSSVDSFALHTIFGPRLVPTFRNSRVSMEEGRSLSHIMLVAGAPSNSEKMIASPLEA